ncbi:MAG: alpha/beta fold hydrolase [Gemmatimonadetes bacterium]|uniref:Alpha/beta fold hydrolase n=1 Tax=Candidatus Kutchimonas denitrificans TaxID=3056748 RepID=A0AAE4Z8P1_9BACT|nr:alpha/beta fold hydrolase [Gemmatimonadota bacterium]NIR74697.1 alpha/beta fold hydrolase [Candidatus Kutchimonas denitrificans]NIS01447.1 alpha/beta fold hydrolase [Gemmatimonadota bacterium]NIT67188.1 alpha/beta fold hydrolase [Gemmatimonadota bacterium]NIU52362.1 alpha/beta fold hydrolase [Gemmatimonadota bacterium]
MGKRRVLTARGPIRGTDTTRHVVPRRLRVGSHRFHYVEAGMGAPLLLIHGLGASSRWWFPILPELSSAHFRLLAPDLPGFGRSPGPALNVEHAARSVVALADHLGLGQFFVCGHSMGGAIAAEIAANHPGRIRRLVLIDSAGIPGIGASRVLGRLVQPWSWCPGWFYRTLVGDVLRAGPKSMLRGIRELRRHDIRPTLNRVRSKTLIIWGANDTLTPAAHSELMLSALPDGRLELVPGARHLPMIRKPALTGGLIASFCREELKAR